MKRQQADVGVNNQNGRVKFGRFRVWPALLLIDLGELDVADDFIDEALSSSPQNRSRR